MRLFEKECQKIFKSVIYWVFIIVLMIFYFTNFGNTAGFDVQKAEQAGAEYSASNLLMEPPKDAVNYGFKEGDNPSLVMKRTAISLARDYSLNRYSTWPNNGFGKEIHLDDSGQERVGKMLTEITGLSPEAAIELVPDTELRRDDPGVIQQTEHIPIKITNSDFKSVMQDLDKLLGGYSAYSTEKLQENDLIPVTYEEKLEQYQQFLQEDKVTGAYARLFCDYMGLAVSLFSVFLPVAFLLRDRRAQIQELIYFRKVSSARLIITRYLSCVALELLPVILLSLIPNFQLLSFAAKSGLYADPFLFFKYIFWWIVPTLLTTVSVGFTLTTLTDTPIAIAVQFVWSFFSMSSGSLTKINGGYYPLSELAIRHNTLGNYNIMQNNIQTLNENRLFYSAFAIILLIISIILYELKRRGIVDVHAKLHALWNHSQDSDEIVEE